MTSDRVLGGLAILGAGAMAAACWNYAAPIAYEPVGPRAFPLVLAALLAVCGAWLVAKPAPNAAFGSEWQPGRIAACAAAIVAYAALFQLLGFVLATALMTLPVGRIFGGSWRQCVLTGIIMGVVLFVLFDKALDVVLPTGVLKPVFALVGW
jgi:putative tricarboxylic transport membrane protein